MFIELLLNKEEGLTQGEYNIQSVFTFPDKETIHKVTSSGTLSRQNSLHSTPLKSPLGAVLPTLKFVQDDLSISILMLDVLIKQVCCNSFYPAFSITILFFFLKCYLQELL